jgi:hypothetical protein
MIFVCQNCKFDFRHANVGLLGNTFREGMSKEENEKLDSVIRNAKHLKNLKAQRKVLRKKYR